MSVLCISFKGKILMDKETHNRLNQGLFLKSSTLKSICQYVGNREGVKKFLKTLL